MGSSFSNDYLKKLEETVLNNSWMNSLYGTQRAEQQEALKGVFTRVADNDVTADEKKALENKAEAIQEKVERLEAKMAVLEEELAKNQAEIARHADDIAALVTKAETASEKAEKAQQEHVKNVIEDVFWDYETGGALADRGPDAIVPEIRARLESGIMKNYGVEVQAILKQMDAKKAEVANLVASADKWINQKKVLEAQYGATKSTYELLKVTIGRIGATESSYTNSDFDKSIPVFSPEKANLVAKYAENANINVEAGPNKNYQEGTTAPTLESLATVKEKYKDYLGTQATGGVDSYSANNKAVQNLGKALDEGLFDDLAATGLSANQITDFLAENFAGANIKKNGNNITIPYGHGTEAQKIFGKLTDSIKNYNTTFKGIPNTWDENCGNTIDSNKQIESLANNYATILEDMKSNGFTFKEAMFALFDPEYGIFKDSGVSYNLDKQTGNPNYFIQYGGDDATAEMYKGLSDTIYEYWGVKASRGIGVEGYEGDDPVPTPEPTDPEPTDPVPTTITRSDPIWFNLDDDKNNKFSFIVDRDGDGAFTDSTEFVGGSENSTWLEDLKALDTNNDGKLTGEELENLKVLGTKFEDGAAGVNDNNEYVPEKTASDNQYERETTTNIEYTLTSAAGLGITEIDLNGLEEQVNNSQNIFDVNGSEKFNDSFTFKMGDQEVTAHRQDETNLYMDTVYGDVYGKGFELGLNDNQVQEVMDKNYGEFDQFAAKYAAVFANINMLKNIGHLKNEIQAQHDDTVRRVADYETVELIKAGNKAAAEKNAGSGWTKLESEVSAIARSRGIAIDMVQAKGIYVLNAGLSAEQIVDKYQELVEMEADIALEQDLQKEIWKSIIQTTQAGITASLDEIKELLKSGKAKTAAEVVAILSKEQGIDVTLVTQELGFDSEREKEIYESFNRVFANAGLEDKVVEALYELCVRQQNNPKYMENKSGTELAQEILKDLYYIVEELAIEPTATPNIDPA